MDIIPSEFFTEFDSIGFPYKEIVKILVRRKSFFRFNSYYLFMAEVHYWIVKFDCLSLFGEINVPKLILPIMLGFFLLHAKFFLYSWKNSGYINPSLGDFSFFYEKNKLRHTYINMDFCDTCHMCQKAHTFRYLHFCAKCSIKLKILVYYIYKKSIIRIASLKQVFNPFRSK